MNKPLVALLSVCLMGFGSVALAENNAMTNDQNQGSTGMKKSDTMGKDTMKSEDSMMKEPPSAGMSKSTTSKKGAMKSKKHTKKMSKDKDNMSSGAMERTQ